MYEVMGVVLSVALSLTSLTDEPPFIAGSATAGSTTIPYRLLPPADIEDGRRYPLVLFLHGAGERGDDNRSQLTYLPKAMSRAPFREKFPCYLLAPQCPKQVS